MVASVTVTTDGAADGTLKLSWFHGDSATSVGTIVATEPVPLPEGKTQISQRYSHTFAVPDSNSYLGLQISTSPAAESGNGSFATIPAPSSCNPVR
jgi:serine/threonine-protein kinase